MHKETSFFQMFKILKVLPVTEFTIKPYGKAKVSSKFCSKNFGLATGSGKILSEYLA